MTNFGYPYNRIVQWLSGPVSAGVGLLFGYLAVRLHIVVPSSVKNPIVLGISSTVLSAVGAGLTYLAHHKWFDNLVKMFVSAQNSSAVTTYNNTNDVPVEEDDVQGLNDVSSADNVPGPTASTTAVSPS